MVESGLMTRYPQDIRFHPVQFCQNVMFKITYITKYLNLPCLFYMVIKVVQFSHSQDI